MQLVGLKGIHWTQIFPLTAPEVTIGREAGNTIVCDGDSRVSRKHARLIASGLGYVIEDLGSANGTFVNGVQIAGQRMLADGDEIRIGGQSYRFDGAPASPAMAPPPPGPMPPRPREVSSAERAQSYTPGTERIYGGGGLSDNPGCAMPNFNLPDLSGCLKILLYIILAIIILMVIGGLLMLLGSGIGALGGLAGGHGGGSSSSSSSSSGGGQQGNQPEGGREQQGEGIHIESVRVVVAWSPKLGKDAPRALVTWDNFTRSSIHKIWATAISRDASGNEIGRAEDVVIYDGKPVAAATSHEDSTLAHEGFDPPGPTKPAVVDVVVTRYE
ncbi:MAG TPA: FHA domain-containing protein [Fimbriimonadaceae bacterium]|nr:FHA domain-containing protein [Fimbriimonadaceae bacterium]